MADFCKQCSIDMFGDDWYDLAGLSDEEQTASGLFAGVLCEGCGPTQVDHLGKCVNPDCLKQHGKQGISKGD
jgi:hypothetical protein